MMTVLGGIHPDRETAKTALARLLDNGTACDIFRRMVEAQGGDPAFIDDPSALPQPGCMVELPSPRAGTVEAVDAQIIGRIVLQLGGGRQAVTDMIDPAAGIDHLVQRGEQVEKGQPLMRLLAKDRATIEPHLAAAAQAVTYLGNGF